MSGKFANIKPSSHDYTHLPKSEKNRYDALSKLTEDELRKFKSRNVAALKKHQQEIKLANLVLRDRAAKQERR